MSQDLAHYAALAVFRAGGSIDEAAAAARSAIRPGGVVDWNERYISRRAVETAAEEFASQINGRSP